MAKYSLLDERGDKAREAGHFDAPDDVPLAELLRRYEIAPHLTVFRRTPRGGYVLLRKGERG